MNSSFKQVLMTLRTSHLWFLEIRLTWKRASDKCGGVMSRGLLNDLLFWTGNAEARDDVVSIKGQYPLF